MIFAGGHISGGHFNPAVTLGVWMRGKCDTKDLVLYWVAQVIASVIAALILKYFKAGAVITPGNLQNLPALLAEFLFTFALVFVVLNVATAKGTSGNSFYGLAIGMTVMVGAFSVGNISGGAFNPGVAIGVTLMGLSGWPSIWILLVGELLGGAVAALAFKIVNPAD